MIETLFRWARSPSLLAGALLLTAAAGCHRSEPGAQIDYDRLREEVITQIRQGSIPLDPTGTAILPDRLKPAAPGGQVYVARNAEMLLVVFILSEDPESGSFSGLLYTQNPIGENIKRVRAGSYQLNLRLRNNEHWYIVDNRPS